MDNKIAEFRILTRSGVQMVENFSIPYISAKHLNKLTQVIRESWDEYFIEVETDLFTQSFSYTYSEEVLMNNK